MENLTEEIFGFETLEDYGVDALGAAGTACSNNSSNSSLPPVEDEIDN